MELIRGPNGELLVPPYAFIPRDPAGKVEFLRSAWYRSQVTYDVSPWLTESQTPMLALYGSLDQVVDASQNVAFLQTTGREADAVMLPGLNHLLQKAATGSPMEYLLIEGGVSPTVTQQIVDWLER